ncbi:MAG TPA: hypothetical protein VG013_15530 [Gemmataceae bacterium]|jgi:hypothetical protein|nr:hypothetical protein [Gemmataceae bacterium]
MAIAVAAETPVTRWIQPSELVVDPEFQDLVPWPVWHALNRLGEFSLRDGCGEALIVWKRGGQFMLLVGYSRWCLEAAARPVLVLQREFAGPRQARRFVIRHHLAGGALTPALLSYLRALRCRDCRRRPGDGGGSARLQPSFVTLRSADELAELYRVRRRAIDRDVAFAAAVDTLAANSSDVVRQLILCRGTALPRKVVMQLARRELQEQRRVIRDLLATG